MKEIFICQNNYQEILIYIYSFISSVTGFSFTFFTDSHVVFTFKSVYKKKLTPTPILEF